MKRGHSPSFISRPHRLPLPSLCLCATIKSFLCSLLLHKNQCSPFSAPLSPPPPPFLLHSSIIGGCTLSSLPRLLSPSHTLSPRPPTPSSHFLSRSWHADHTDRSAGVAAELAPFRWREGGWEGGGRRVMYTRRTAEATGRESDGGDRGSPQKRKRYCNGTPAGGRVSGGDIIVASPSDASSSPPDAKHPLA